MPTLKNGNGKLWGTIASIVLFTFGSIIGALYSQLEHATQFVSVKTYDRDTRRLEGQLQQINDRLDDLLEFHTKDGG